MRGVQAALMLAQEAAEDLEDVAEAAYTPSEGGYAQVRLPARTYTVRTACLIAAAKCRKRAGLRHNATTPESIQAAPTTTAKTDLHCCDVQTSYYGTLGLYLVSLPGLYSTITRAVKFKPIQKVYVAPGPAAGREVRQTAGEISAYFRAMNFQPEPTGDKITFRGTMGRSRGQAAFLTFVTFLSMASLAIVLTIQYPLVPVYSVCTCRVYVCTYRVYVYKCCVRIHVSCVYTCKPIICIHTQ